MEILSVVMAELLSSLMFYQPTIFLPDILNFSSFILSSNQSKLIQVGKMFYSFGMRKGFHLYPCISFLRSFHQFGLCVLGQVAPTANRLILD